MNNSEYVCFLKQTFFLKILKQFRIDVSEAERKAILEKMFFDAFLADLVDKPLVKASGIVGILVFFDDDDLDTPYLVLTLDDFVNRRLNLQWFEEHAVTYLGKTYNEVKNDGSLA